jgi:hypothetical protein
MSMAKKTPITLADTIQFHCLRANPTFLTIDDSEGRRGWIGIMNCHVRYASTFANQLGPDAFAEIMAWPDAHVSHTQDAAPVDQNIETSLDQLFFHAATHEGIHSKPPAHQDFETPEVERLAVENTYNGPNQLQDMVFVSEKLISIDGFRNAWFVKGDQVVERLGAKAELEPWIVVTLRNMRRAADCEFSIIQRHDYLDALIPESEHHRTALVIRVRLDETNVGLFQLAIRQIALRTSSR